MIPRPPIQQSAHAQTVATKQNAVVKQDEPKPIPETPVPNQPTFDAQKPETWPKCADDEFVRADNGQCAKKPAEAPVVAQTAPTPVAAVNYGSHEQMLAAAGIAQSDWGAADYIVMHEGHYCPTIWNGETGCPAYHGYNTYKAYGVCQALSPQKMASAGDDWDTNAITQLRWCDSYAKSRFGGWWAAYSYWQAHGNW